MSIELIVDKLNEMFELDKAAFASLIKNRVYCNQALANHSTCQVAGDGTEPTVGMMGIINGFVEPLTGKRIGAKFGDKGELAGFQVYTLPAKIRFNIKDDTGPIEI